MCREIIEEIRSITTVQHSVSAVFGIGSFFRGEVYKDIDLVLVLATSCDYLDSYYTLRSAFEALGHRIGVNFDLVFLTEEEFPSAPLRERGTMTPIYPQMLHTDGEALPEAPDG
jgi:hypothetical protein